MSRPELFFITRYSRLNNLYNILESDEICTITHRTPGYYNHPSTVAIEKLTFLAASWNGYWFSISSSKAPQHSDPSSNPSHSPKPKLLPFHNKRIGSQISTRSDRPYQHHNILGPSSPNQRDAHFQPFRLLA